MLNAMCWRPFPAAGDPAAPQKRKRTHILHRIDGPARRSAAAGMRCQSSRRPRHVHIRAGTVPDNTVSASPCRAPTRSLWRWRPTMPPGKPGQKSSRNQGDVERPTGWRASACRCRPPQNPASIRDGMNPPPSIRMPNRFAPRPAHPPGALRTAANRQTESARYTAATSAAPAKCLAPWRDRILAVACAVILPQTCPRSQPAPGKP